MDEEDTLRLGADAYLAKLLDRKSLLQRFISSLKIGAIALSLILSIYAASNCNKSLQDLPKLAKLQLSLQNEMRMHVVERRLIDRLNGSSRTDHGTLLDLKQKVKKLTDPKPMFDCYRVNRLTRSQIVPYDGCFVDNTGGAMDASAGVFNVSVSGIYQLSFTAKYVSSNLGRFGSWSDIHVNHDVVADSQREYRGGSDPLDPHSSSGSQSESSTHTVMLMYPLHTGDRVYVQFNKDSNSYMHSDNDKDVHFTARLVQFT